MTVTALATIGHAAGCTTTAVGLTSRWPRPAVLIEADTNTTSSILSGAFRGAHDSRRGLTGLLTAARHGELTTQTLWDQALPLERAERLIVPGFANLGAAQAGEQFWLDLAELLEQLDAAGVDALIDIGRLNVTADPRLRLLERADLTLLVTGTTLPDLAALVAPVNEVDTVLSRLRGTLEVVGHADWLGTVLVDRASDTYDAREISRLTGLTTIGHLPWAPGAAAHYSTGKPLSRRALRGLDHALDATIAGIHRHHDQRAAALNGDLENHA